MINKQFVCDEKYIIFSMLQMAFDSKMLRGALNPEDPENADGVWKDKGFYNLICLEEDTTIEGTRTIRPDEDVFYRIVIERAPSTEETADGRCPVNVICTSDIGFYTAQYTNTEFGCIVNYFKNKRAAGMLCLEYGIPELCDN